MRRAMLELAKLGDMDRSVADQEAEMRDLELRIGRQRAVLRELGQAAAAGAGAGAV